MMKNDTIIRQKQPKWLFVVTLHLVVTTHNIFVVNKLFIW